MCVVRGAWSKSYFVSSLLSSHAVFFVSSACLKGVELLRRRGGVSFVAKELKTGAGGGGEGGERSGPYTIPS